MLPISGCAGKPEPAERKSNAVNKTAGRESVKPGSGRQNSTPTTSGQGQLSEFVSYRNNLIHAALRLDCSLYSNINTKEVVMFWSYVQLDDGTQFAYSETREDGTVRVAVERPVDFGFDHAECLLPAVKWFNVEGFTADDLNFLTEFVRSNAPFIFELAERQKAGPAVAALAR